MESKEKVNADELVEAVDTLLMEEFKRRLAFSLNIKQLKEGLREWAKAFNAEELDRDRESQIREKYFTYFDPYETLIGSPTIQMADYIVTQLALLDDE